MQAGDAAARLDELQIVDVRSQEEWDAGHVDGSRHVVLARIQSGDGIEALDRSRPVVTVCHVGERSAQAAKLLQQRGFDAETLDGGLSAWAAAGHPLVASDGSDGRVLGDEPQGELSPELAHLQDVFLEMVFAVQEHFGDHEPSEEEVRQFLRDRLIGQGSTPDEADRFLDEL